MSIHKVIVTESTRSVGEKEAGNRSLSVHGPHELAKKILRKKLSRRTRTGIWMSRRRSTFAMSALIDRYWKQYASKKKSNDREKSVLEGIREELGSCLSGRLTAPRSIAGIKDLTAKRALSAGTAVRHFNVMHHMMEKASTIWSKETGIDRNSGRCSGGEAAGRSAGAVSRGGRNPQAEKVPSTRRCTGRARQGHQPNIFPFALDRSDRADRRGCGLLKSSALRWGDVLYKEDL